MASLKQILEATRLIGRRYVLQGATGRYDRRSDAAGQLARSGLRGGVLKGRIDDLLESPGLTGRMVASPLHALPQGGKRVHFSWDIPAVLLPALPGSTRLRAAVTDYLGPQVRLDDLYVKTVLDGLSSASEGWHDDNVGYRLKLFMVFDTEGQPSGTLVLPTERPHLTRYAWATRSAASSAAR